MTQTKLSTTQAALQTFGIKVTPVEIDKLRMQQLFAMDREVDKVAKDYQSKLRKFEQNLIDETELQKHTDTFESRLKKIFDKYQKREEGPAKEEPKQAEPVPSQPEAAPAAPNVIRFVGPDGKPYNVKVKPGQTEADVEKYIMGKYYSAEKKAKGGAVDSGEDYTKYNDRILKAFIKRYGSEKKAREVMRVTDGGELLRVMREEESKAAYSPTEQDLLRRYSSR